MARSCRSLAAGGAPSDVIVANSVEPDSALASAWKRARREQWVTSRRVGASPIGAVALRDIPTPVLCPCGRLAGFVLRALCGELANAALINGQRAIPKRAQELGLRFDIPTVEEALQSLLR